MMDGIQSQATESKAAPSAAAVERQALRSALVQLMESEEALPDSYMPELNVVPDVSALRTKHRYRELRIGSIAAGTDVLDASASSVVAGAASVALPGDRLATSVTFSGFADVAGTGTEQPDTGTIVHMAAQQRDQHRAALILQGAHTGAEDRTVR